MNVDHDFPPEAWTQAELEASFAAAPVDSPIPRYDEVTTWEAIRTDELTAPTATWLIGRAAGSQHQPIPDTRASAFLEYERSGTRRPYGNPFSERQRRLSIFALAECVERSGRFLDDVLDYLYAVCEQTSWVVPPHFDGDLPATPGGTPERVALRSARTALLMAEIDYIFGDHLHPSIRGRIRTEVDQRVHSAYEDGDFGWMHPPTNNWNAVCHAGVVGSACYLEADPARLAAITRKALDHLPAYLGGFDRDGGNTEGISYWNYGFGYYTILSSILEARTAGQYSLLTPPVVRRIATFPLRIELSPGRFPAFSDAQETARVSPYTACYLGTRFEMPELAARGRREYRSLQPELSRKGSLVEATRSMVWCREATEGDDVWAPPRRTFLPGSTWWLARVDPNDPDGLVVAAKAGHNAEQHNNNDCGSVIAHYRGESLITDPGRDDYDAGYFGPRRYTDYLATRSLGHSVPYVNETEQAAGEAYAADVIERAAEPDRDRYVVDLTDAYPSDANLESLVRHIDLDRTAGSAGTLTLVDSASFTDTGPATLESIIISYAPMSADGELIVKGDTGQVIVAVEPTDAELTVECLPAAIKDRDVYRGRISVAGADELELQLEIRPVPIDEPDG